MKNKFIKIFLLVALLSPVFYLVPKVTAQTGGCDVTNVTTRTTRQLGQQFFTENSRPFFYIDLTTQGCVGQSFQISITEEDNVTSYDLGDNDISIMDNFTVSVTAGTTNNFTLALKAGEDECEQTSNGSDCRYHIETTDDGGGFEWPQVSGYECDGVCDMDWEYFGVIPFGTTHASDPDVSNGGGNNNSNTNGNISTNSNGSTVINLNLINPIGSTVSSTTAGINSLPEFFQKVIEVIIKIAIPLTAIILVYCGLLFVTARGDSAQIEKARHAFTYAVIGGLVLLSSWLIAEAIQDALTSLAYAI